MPGYHPTKLLPSQDYLRICFHYDPETGALVWKRRPRAHFPTDNAWMRWNGRFSSQPAGHRTKDGYYVVGLNSTLYLAHRLIWKWMTDQEPPENPDHHDRDPTNNRWNNLRPATKQQNSWNSKVRTDNTSGRRGIHRTSNGRYEAYIWISGTKRHLGTFDTLDEAANVYEAAAREQRGDFMA